MIEISEPKSKEIIKYYLNSIRLVKFLSFELTNKQIDDIIRRNNKLNSFLEAMKEK